MSRVLLLFNQPVLPAEHPDAESERDVLHTVEAVQLALREHQHDVLQLGLTNSPELLIQTCKSYQPDVVFNLFEGFGDRPASEYFIAGLLDWLNIPFTGCPLEAMVLGRDKIRSKYLLRGAGLPTAEFHVVCFEDEVPTPQHWPVIVKPSGTDASIGITQKSVVSDLSALRTQVSLVHQQYQQPALVESYLPGKEYNVGVIEYPELRALPIAEMVYTPQAGVAWPIVSYASKWEPGSPEDLAMQPRCPAMVDVSLRAQLEQIALQAFQLIHCRDFARIDIRLDAAGKPFILEVNPNPDLGPSAGLARMLRVAGIEYAEFIHQLVMRRSLT